MSKKIEYKERMERGHRIEYGINVKNKYPDIWITLKGETEKIRGFHAKSAYTYRDTGEFICYGIYTKNGIVKISESFHKELLKVHKECIKKHYEEKERRTREIYLEKAKKAGKKITDLIGISPVIENGLQVGENYHYISATPDGDYKNFKVFMG